MDERVMQFRVGVMVLATLLITAILVVIFGSHPTSVGTYEIKIQFRSAPNVTKDTPIRKSGVLVGRVVDVELNESGVLVTAKINDKFPPNLFRNDRPHINPTLLGGDSVIEFSLLSEASSSARRAGREEIKPGEPISGVTTSDPLEMMAQMQTNFSGVINSLTQTSDEMGRLATRFNAILDNNRGGISKMIDNADSTMAAIRTTMGNFNDVVADPTVRQKVKDAVRQLPVLFQDVRETLAKFNGGFELVTSNLHNMEKFTQPLGERGPVMISHFDSVAQDLDMLVNQMSVFAQRLNTSQGTVGQLVNNPELYNNVNNAVLQVNTLIKELRPIINDARVFTDKIARHPETLGVRGALERNAGIK
jgi:phospholipid/cholesterol/gamma-HCH transport system substrate-binding protein